jgi:hypothetical protein
MSNKKNNANVFPEYQNSCPDYWTINEQNVCIPSMINTPSPSRFLKKEIKHSGVSFNDDTKPTKITSLDVGETNWVSLCEKSRWAYANGILWDGITNNNSCA